MSLRKENHIYKSTIVLYFLILHARISDGSSFTKKRKKKGKKKLCAFRDWTTRLYYLCIKSKNTNTLLFNLCTSVGRKFICHDSLSCFFFFPLFTRVFLPLFDETQASREGSAGSIKFVPYKIWSRNARKRSSWYVHSMYRYRNLIFFVFTK